LPDLSITYRTTGPWGAGLGHNLTAPEVDGNMYSIAQAITALQDDRPEPANITSISVAGRFMTITLDNGAIFGPFPLPITEFRFRDEWQPETIYNALDWFTVSGVGIFSVMYDHTSGAEFDPNILVEGLPGLKKLFGPDAGSITNSTVYDVEFMYLGNLADIASPLNFVALRSIIIPAADVHRAYIAEPASSVDQVLPVMHDAGVIGHVTFPVGSTTGIVTIDADETIGIGERLAIGAPAASDGVAKGMTIGIAAQRVLPPTS
jgi:hypothetical protein